MKTMSATLVGAALLLVLGLPSQQAAAQRGSYKVSVRFFNPFSSVLSGHGSASSFSTNLFGFPVESGFSGVLAPSGSGASTSSVPVVVASIFSDIIAASSSGRPPYRPSVRSPYRPPPRPSF